MNWERVRLGDIVNIRTGKLDANAAVENGEFPFFTCAKEISRIDNYAFDGECVLVAGNGDLNVKYYNGKFNAYQRTYVIQTSNETLDIKYLYYFLEEYLEELRIKSIGGVIKYIKLENLQEPKIPLPPLSVQKEIVEKLDKAAAIREKSKVLLAHYDALAESLFIELFGDPISNEKGWEKKKLGEVGLSISNIKNDFTKDEIYYIDIGSIDNEINEVVSVTKYLLDERPSRAQQILNKGDVLFSTVRPNLRNIAINQEDGLIGSTGFYVIRTGENIKNKFLFRLLLSDSITKDFESMVSGANYPSLRKTDLDDYEIIIPPLSLQVKFAEMVENIEEQKVRAKAEIEQSEAVFQALLQESFG